MQSSPDANFIWKRKIRVKITGDRTKIGKRLSVVNFGFTIYDGEAVYSAAGNYCIAIIKEQESYDSLKPALQDLKKSGQ